MVRNMPNKVYITGATGRLGSAVLARLPDAIPLVRKPSGLKNEIVTKFSESELHDILKNASVIIHLAGSVDTLDGKKLQEANVELTRRIVSVAYPACKLIFASSISVYGKKLAKIPADEGTKTNPDSAYAKSKLDAEEFVASHPNHVILRISTLYGPQFEDYNRVLSMIERGKMQVIGDGSNRIPFVHVDDVADAVVSAVKNGSGTYVLAGEPLTQKEIYEIAAKSLGVSPPTKSVSLQLAFGMASLHGHAYRLGAKKPALTAEHVSILGHDRAFDCSKAKKELGFSPRPLEKGIAAMAKMYKAKLVLTRSRVG